MHVEVGSWSHVSSSITLHVVCWSRDSHWAWNSLTWPAWLVRLQRTPCLCFTYEGVRGPTLASQIARDPPVSASRMWGLEVSSHTYLASTWVLETWTPGPVLEGRALCLAIHLPSPLIILFESIPWQFFSPAINKAHLKTYSFSKHERTWQAWALACYSN